MGDILELVDRYQELLEKKAALADETKENNKALEELRQELSEQMIEQEVPRISRGGYSFSLTEKVNYSKRSEEYLYENGLDFFETLRENGLAVLETVCDLSARPGQPDCGTRRPADTVSDAEGHGRGRRHPGGRSGMRERL